MVQPLRHEPSRNAFKKRRREVEAHLAELSAKKLRFPRPVDDADAELGRALADTLRRLGPTFSALGAHLGARMDLLGEDARRELGALDEAAAPTPTPAVRELVVRELGPSAAALAHLEPRPGSCRLLHQVHRARLRSGELVDVKIVHPELEEHFAYDLELLPALEGVLSRLARHHGCRLDVAECLAQLRRTLESEVELLDEIDALSAFAADAKSRDGLAVPRVFTELGTSRLLVREALAATGLDELMARSEPDGEPSKSASDLARAWLRQVLSGRVFTIDPKGGDVAFSPDGRVAFFGGGAAYPTPSFQRHLRRYLDATIAQDPDDAFSAMLSEMAVAPEQHENELRRRFRQLLPFRDGPRDFRGDQVADYLLMHWRLAAARGYRPKPLLLAFYRGLHRMRDHLRRLAPEGDVLCEAFGELRLESELGQWREAVDTKRISLELAQYGALLAGLPRKVNEALTRAAAGNVRLKIRLADHDRAPPSSSPAMALLPALVATALLARHLANTPLLAEWSEQLGALVLVLLGGWLLGTMREHG